MAGKEGTERDALAGARVLVTEDQAASVAEALRLVGPGMLDAALLDLGLLDGFAVPVAEALGAAGVPFALVTGYPEGRLDHPALHAAPRLAKPFAKGEFRRTLACLRGAPA